MSPSFLIVSDAAPRPEAELEGVREARAALAHLSGQGSVRVEAAAESQERQSFVLPEAAVDILRDVLAYLADGRSLAVLPREAELDLDEAAALLNVSPAHVAKLLDEGRLEGSGAGTRRGIRLRDLLAYRARRRAEADAAMDELVAQAQELGLGYGH